MGEQSDTIRPYADAEVPAVLARLLADDAFLGISLSSASRAWLGLLGWLFKPLIAYRLRLEFRDVSPWRNCKRELPVMSTTPLSKRPMA